MKPKHLFAFSALVVWVSSAFAYTTLGDRAQYRGNLAQYNGPIVDVAKTLEVVRYKAAQKKWIIKQTQTVGGKTKVKIDDGTTFRLQSSDMLAKLLRNCEAHGGTPAKIEVPAGSFSTCLINTNESDNEFEQTWYGNVPFGIVQKIEKDKRKTLTLQLQNFRVAPSLSRAIRGR